MVSLTTEYVLMNFIVHFHPLQAVKVSEFLRTPLFYSFFSCLMKISKQIYFELKYHELAPLAYNAIFYIACS